VVDAAEAGDIISVGISAGTIDAALGQ